MTDRKELVERLRRAFATASNDDVSKPGTAERIRHNERLAALEDAIAALSEQEKPVAVKVDDTAWAKVRIDTEPDAHGFCFCTPYARHPDDAARDLPTEEWNGSSQFYGQVTREPSPRKEGSGDA